MKKLFNFFTILAFLGCSTYFVKAQSSVEGGVIVMPQFTALLNTQDFAAGKDLDYSLTTGFAGGLSGAYNFNNHVGIEINLILSSQGEKYKGNLNYYKFNGADTTSYASIVAFQAGAGYSPSNQSWPAADTAFTAKVSLTYLKIPILFKLTSNSDKSAFFYMNIGPEFNILVSATQTLNGSHFSYSTYNFTTKQLYKSSGIDLVLNLGAGFHLSSNLILTTQINFDYGLTDAENKSFVIPGTSSHAFPSNRSTNPNGTAGLRLGLAYKFGSS